MAGRNGSMTRYSLPPGHGLLSRRFRALVAGIVYSMRTMDDAMLVKEALEAGIIRSAVVVGASMRESNWWNYSMQRA